MIINNIRSVTKALDKRILDVDIKTMKARDEMMNRLITLAKEEIKGLRQPGEVATSGQPPMNRTGNLRRSIKGKKNRVGFANYTAIVGPTIIYGRAVELGGAPTWRNGQHFPYMLPALQKFQREAFIIIKKYLA
jgi:phage gpG-like protein